MPHYRMMSDEWLLFIHAPFALPKMVIICLLLLENL